MSQAVLGTQPVTKTVTTNRNLVAAWLFAVCFMIWVMVGIGGYTRDTGSGLSIMDWDPIIGTLPPLSQPPGTSYSRSTRPSRKRRSCTRAWTSPASSSSSGRNMSTGSGAA